LETPPAVEEETDVDPAAPARLPGLGWSLLPIILPIAMIASDPVIGPMWKSQSPESFAEHGEWLKVFAEKNVAMLASAFIAVALWVFTRWPRRDEVSQMVEEALTSAGMIILITAAGGAFGKSLDQAGVGQAIQIVFPGEGASGISVL